MEIRQESEMGLSYAESGLDTPTDSSPLLALRDALAQLLSSHGGGLSLREMRHLAEREAIIRALREHQGQVPAAAASLGISRAQLYRLIGRLRLEDPPTQAARPPQMQVA